MRAIGYYNGTMGELDKMTVPMLDRAVYFGDGCYEACMVHDGVPFALAEHLARFGRSLGLLSIPFSMTESELKRVLFDCIAASEAADAVLYWQCSRGTAPRSHAFPDPSHKPNLLVMVTPKPVTDASVRMRLITVPDVRFTMCNVKTLNLLPNVLANEQAHAAGADGAVLHRDGVVTEGSHTNIHILKDGVLLTHPADKYILRGVTRERLLRIAREAAIPVVERAFTLDALRAADEILITSSILHVRAADTLDGQPVGGRDAARLSLLQTAYLRQFFAETEGKQA